MALDLELLEEFHEVEIQGAVFICKEYTGMQRDKAVAMMKNKKGEAEHQSEFYKYLFNLCVIDWKEIERGGVAYECTPENKKELFTKNYSLCESVIDLLVKKIRDNIENELGN